MYSLILLLHVLAATIWTGGHLVLAITILPRALNKKTLTDLLRFESGYEKIGVPALIIQGVTGLWLAHNLMPDLGLWFSLDKRSIRSIISPLQKCLILSMKPPRNDHDRKRLTVPSIKNNSHGASCDFLIRRSYGRHSEMASLMA